MTTTTTLADVAATALSAVRVLESYGLDYCCGGKQPFDEACRSKGLRPETVLQAIEQARSTPHADRDWQVAPLHELASHIIATHHEYLKLELPALGNRMDKVLAVHGAKDASIERLADLYVGLRMELEMHLHKEEMILFPFIDQYGRAEAAGKPVPPVPFGTIANPIGVMEREHDSAGQALAELRSLTNGYTLPNYACATVKALYEGLTSLETDLHVHIHLENNILFPRAIALERR
jgi:regulator of cell morphogenesis and NO signaling